MRRIHGKPAGKRRRFRLEEYSLKLLRLNEALAASDASLRLKIEELAASEEELRQKNEMLASSEESLRLKNESLEASEEELRLKNECLAATEEELRQKNETLASNGEAYRRMNEDLESRRDFLQDLVYYDAATELPNRVLLEETASDLVSMMASVRLFRVKLAGTERIRESVGGVIGEEFMKRMAARIRKAAANSVLVARSGTDEFSILTTP